jgi:hypothetical protein
MAILPIKIMMERQLHELLRILNAEYEVFVSCLERLTDQQRFLQEDDKVAFSSNRRGLSHLVRKAAELETRRKTVIEAISKEMNLRAGDKSVMELLDSLKEPGFRGFSELKKTIIDAYDKAEIQKRRNDSLIRQSMDIIGEAGDSISRIDDLRNIASRRLAIGDLQVTGLVLAEKSPFDEAVSDGTGA